MRIVVCMKQVPDTSGKIAVNENGTLNRASMQAIANPDDMCALEAALQFKELYGAHVCVMSMGPLSVKEMLREMLARGADEAVLVSGREFGGSDTFATSQILAAAIVEYGIDEETLVFCGRQAIDGDTAQVGPQIAEKLGIAQITYVCEMYMKENMLYCARKVDDARIYVRAKLPCLVTCVKGMNEPRFMNVPDIMRACASEITLYDYAKLANNPLIESDTIGLKGSPTNIFKSFTLKQKDKQVQVINGSECGCRQFVEDMMDKFVIRRGV